MFLPVQNRLIQVGNAPALRNVIGKEPGQFLCGFSGGRVSPRTEGSQLVSLLIKGEVAVHHAGDPNRSHLLQFYPLRLLHILHQFPIATLQSAPDLLQIIGPDSVFVAIFPVVSTGSKHFIIRSDQDRLDSGRSQLNSQNRLPLFDRLFPCCHAFSLLVESESAVCPSDGIRRG